MTPDQAEVFHQLVIIVYNAGLSFGQFKLLCNLSVACNHLLIKSYCRFQVQSWVIFKCGLALNCSNSYTADSSQNDK